MLINNTQNGQRIVTKIIYNNHQIKDLSLLQGFNIKPESLAQDVPPNANVAMINNRFQMFTFQRSCNFLNILQNCRKQNYFELKF